MLELAVASKTPIMEAEYAIDDESPLSLYNCLIPKIKEHRRFRIQTDSKFSIEDFKAQIKVKQLQLDLENSQFPRIMKENEEMVKEIIAMNNDLKIVKFYEEVMHDGVNIREIVMKYSLLKKEHKSFKTASNL